MDARTYLGMADQRMDSTLRETDPAEVGSATAAARVHALEAIAAALDRLADAVAAQIS